MATTYYVSGTGNDNHSGVTPKTPFRNIQKAADLTQPGDTVYVMNGVYTNDYPNGNIVKITRSGTANARITYQAYPGHSPKLVSKNWNAFSISGASYITIDGFELQGNNSNLTLEEAISEKNNTDNPLTSGNGIEVRAYDDKYPHHIIIRNNEVYEFGGGGIYTYHADYVTIENNVVYNNAWYSPYGNSGISNYQNWNSDGYTGYKMIIRGNITYNNQNLIPWFQAGKVTDGNGIIIDDARNTQNGSTLGVYQGRSLIENNISYNNGGRGINIYKSNFVDVMNNTIYQNSRHPEIKDGEITITNADDVRVFNNIMNASLGKPANKVYESTNVTSDYNLIFNSSIYDLSGKHDLVGAKPRFLDPSRGNFALRPNSPAINRGTDGLTSKDILGNLRPVGTSADIGAFEGFGIIRGTKKPNRLVGTRLSDWIEGRDGNDRVNGGSGNDRLIGERGADVLTGNQGDDWLIGSTEADYLFGSEGNDQLVGGIGNDVLEGEIGRDRLIGGRGQDIFVLEKTLSQDIVVDFQDKQDRLKFPRNIGFNALKFEQQGTNTLIKLDTEVIALLTKIRPGQITRADFIVL